MSTIEFLLGVAGGYIANQLPGVADRFKKDVSLSEHIERAYQRALKAWCVNDGIRESLSSRMFAHAEGLIELLGQPVDILCTKEQRTLCEMWMDEMRKDEVCHRLIIEHKEDKIAEQNDGIRKQLESLEILIKQQNKSEASIKRGKREHEPVQRYIRRYCRTEKKDNDFARYLFENSKRYTLADYVIGLVEQKQNKYILYGSAQYGKTTELRELCYELQQSGLFYPVLFEVRNSSGLKYEDLPQTYTVEGKRVVVIIDALDEVNGHRREDLLETVCAYASDNPKMTMVLSCRSNYRREDKFDLFQEIYLDDLTTEDIKEYAKTRIDTAEDFVTEIGKNNLWDFARNPFFLSVMVKNYEERGNLPKHRAEIYRLFFEDSFNKHRKEKSQAIAFGHSKDELLRQLERIALAQTLMNVQSLSQEEMMVCVGGDESILRDCQRCDLLQCEDDRWYFVHNALREWLVADYLNRNGLGEAKRLAVHPNRRIKPEWFNIIALWLSMCENKDQAKETIDWLKTSSKELVVNIDKKFVDEQIRNELFRYILGEYKTIGIRIGSILSGEHKALIDFAYSVETVSFIILEISEAVMGTAYYADLVCICFHLPWATMDETTREKLLTVIEGKIAENLKDEDTRELGTLYLSTQYFEKSEYDERYMALFGQSENREIVKAMFGLIGRTGVSDRYADYLFEKESRIGNYQDNGATCVVSRDVVYLAFEKLREPKNIKRLLRHDFKSLFHLFDLEWGDFMEMMNEVLPIVRSSILSGDAEILECLKIFYVGHFDNYRYSCANDKKAIELLEAMREILSDTEYVNQSRNQFLPTVRELQGCTGAKNSDDDKLSLETGLWMTTSDVEEIYKHLSKDCEADSYIAHILQGCPYAEVSRYATEKYREIFQETENERKNRERKKCDFDEFCNYEVFSRRVSEYADEIENQTRHAAHRAFWDNPFENNEYVFDYCCRFTDDKGVFDVNKIKNSLSDKSTYECFFMEKVLQALTCGSKKELITEDVKERMSETAGKILETLVKGQSHEYAEDALKALLQGYCEIDHDKMMELLPFSSVSISRKEDDGYFTTSYSVFDLLTENVDTKALSDRLLQCFRSQERPSYIRYNELVFVRYLLDKRIVGADDVLLDAVWKKRDDCIALADELLQHGRKIDELLVFALSLDDDRFISLCHALVRVDCDKDKLRQKLENRIDRFDDYNKVTALQFLLLMGSVKALHYLNEHDDYIAWDNNFALHYECPEAITLLCEILSKVNPIDIIHNYMRTTILASLQAIALNGEDYMRDVINGLRKVIAKEPAYVYLHRYIMDIEDKYYADFAGYKDIKKVMGIIDNIQLENPNKDAVQNEVHFKDIEKQILECLDTAQTTIDVCVAWFTNESLRDKLLEKKKDDVHVRVIIYRDGVNKRCGVDLTGLEHKEVRGERGGLMHEKYCVVDGETVVSGSYNWTDNAEYKNDEDIVVSKNDRETARKFIRDFNRKWNIE